MAGYDPQTGRLCELFDPRRHAWNDHFRFEAGRIVGSTAIGRTTADVLRLNLPERVEHRRLLAETGMLLA